MQPKITDPNTTTRKEAFELWMNAPNPMVTFFKKLDVVQTERLFDRFFTVETGGGSTGLGLSIAKLLTEKMGGSIAAEYREGRLIVRLEFNECE